jgi:uncharacterized protein (DUF3820 family)
MIPILILNRDRLTCTKALCKKLVELGYGEGIHIIDLGSTYPPLLEWYRENEKMVHYFNNIGHKGIWENSFIKNFSSPWVVVTDSDIALDPDTPAGFIKEMIELGKYTRENKVGLAIRFSNITNPILKPIIEPIERKYWLTKIPHPRHNIFSAPVDTTFCIVKPELPFQYNAIRLADYPITHLDWYSDWTNLTEEEKYYFDHADPKIATTKQHYLNWLSQKHVPTSISSL